MSLGARRGPCAAIIRPSFLAGGLVVVAAACGGLATAAAQPARATRAADEQAIRAATAAYREALDRGDAAAIAALWTADGDICDETGAMLHGRDTASLVADPAAGPRPDFKINDTSLRFVTDDVAVEDGTVEVRLADGGAPLVGRFTAVWTRTDGGWKLAALREARGPEPAGAALLEELDWMVGDWHVVQDGHDAAAAPDRAPDVDMTVRWNDRRTYLLREMTVSAAAAGGTPLVISQRIGWDPLSRRIRSWAFDSDGGHGEATWTRDGGAWIAQTVSVHPDGSQTTSLVIYTHDGRDRCTIRSVPTHADGAHAPHLVMTMIRKPTETRP